MRKGGDAEAGSGSRAGAGMREEAIYGWDRALLGRWAINEAERGLEGEVWISWIPSREWRKG